MVSNKQKKLFYLALIITFSSSIFLRVYNLRSWILLRGDEIATFEVSKSKLVSLDFVPTHVINSSKIIVGYLKILFGDDILSYRYFVSITTSIVPLIPLIMYKLFFWNDNNLLLLIISFLFSLVLLFDFNILFFSKVFLYNWFDVYATAISMIYMANFILKNDVRYYHITFLVTLLSSMVHGVSVFVFISFLVSNMVYFALVRKKINILLDNRTLLLIPFLLLSVTMLSLFLDAGNVNYVFDRLKEKRFGTGCMHDYISKILTEYGYLIAIFSISLVSLFVELIVNNNKKKISDVVKFGSVFVLSFFVLSNLYSCNSIALFPIFCIIFSTFSYFCIVNLFEMIRIRSISILIVIVILLIVQAVEEAKITLGSYLIFNGEKELKTNLDVLKEKKLFFVIDETANKIIATYENLNNVNYSIINICYTNMDVHNLSIDIGHMSPDVIIMGGGCIENNFVEIFREKFGDKYIFVDLEQLQGEILMFVRDDIYGR